MKFLTAFVILLGVLTGPSFAQSPIPESRFSYVADTDFPGGDIASLFDTTIEACERACRGNQSCGSFTFNLRANACFLKSGAGEAIPFVGALSAVRQTVPPELRDTAAARRAQMTFLTEQDFQAADSLARTLARRVGPVGMSASELSIALTQDITGRRFAPARQRAEMLAAITDAGYA